MTIETVPGQEPVVPVTPEPVSDDSQKTFDESYVKKLRDEAASWRTKAKEASDKVTLFEQEKMTETDRLKAETAAAKAETEAAKASAKQALARAEIAQHASKAGVDVSLATRLVDVQFDAEGQPTGVEAAINELLVKHPNLKAGASFNSNTTNGQRITALTIEDVKRMSPDQINARWAEVQIAMEAQK